MPSHRPLEFSALEEGVCAFCGSDCENAALMLEIHQKIERLVALGPGDDGFDAALAEVRTVVDG